MELQDGQGLEVPLETSENVWEDLGDYMASTYLFNIKLELGS